MRLSGPTPASSAKMARAWEKISTFTLSQHEPTGAPTLWVQAGVDVHPLIALCHHRFDSASFERPDPTQDRLQTDPVLISTPQFHVRLRIRLTNGLDFLGQFF